VRRMPAHRMNRDEFHAKLAGYDVDQLGKILWTLYWRGSAPMRERIEAQLDPDAHARQQRRKVEPPSAAAVREEVREFVALARSGAYLAGDRRVSPKERTRWRFKAQDGTPVDLDGAGHRRRLPRLNHTAPRQANVHRQGRRHAHDRHHRRRIRCES
jgi:hypothetical protein